MEPKRSLCSGAEAPPLFTIGHWLEGVVLVAGATRPRLSNQKGLPVRKKGARSREQPLHPSRRLHPPIKNERQVVWSRTGKGCLSGGYRGLL